MPLKPHTDYFFEERNGKGYFLLNGDMGHVEDVAEQMRRAGWQVHKIAKSWLPTKRTGVQYEWYIWVSNSDGSTPYWTDFREFASSYQPVLEQERERERQRTLEELRQSRQQIEQLLDQTQYLQEGRAELEQRLRDISHEYQEIQQVYELFQGENLRLEDENKELRTKAYVLESRIEQLESVIESYQGQGGAAVSSIDYQIAFNTLFPQVEMARPVAQDAGRLAHTPGGPQGHLAACQRGDAGQALPGRRRRLDGDQQSFQRPGRQRAHLLSPLQGRGRHALSGAGVRQGASGTRRQVSQQSRVAPQSPHD